MTQFNYIADQMRRSIRETEWLSVRGRVTHVTGTIIRAQVPGVKTGELCYLHSPGQAESGLAEVVGFAQREALLIPLGEIQGISNHTEVVASGTQHSVGVGSGLLGRVLDGMGRPIDGLGELEVEQQYPVYAEAPDPMTRKMIERPLPLGIRALDTMLTCGEGQRMGIFAAAGGGKSTLLAALCRNASADVTVLALIGERGREVREFIEHDLGSEGLKKAVLVIATSDKSSMERVKAAYVATAIAEFFRNQGKKVLLLMDSVTRFARAQREIGLAAGEPPTRRGFPPSVFATLPKLMERAGNNDKGSITGLYTVLVEGDDMTEPVADETRSILDGHIILSRKLASQGHYPAIDVMASVSRVMTQITEPNHQQQAVKVRKLMAKYEEIELLIKVGEYQQGSDPVADEAIHKIDSIRQFLQQQTHEKSEMDGAIDELNDF